MCRTTPTATCALPATPEAASLARSWVRERLCREHAAAAEGAATLLASEAVTMAVLHGRPPLAVSVECRVTRVLISVADAADGDLVPGDPVPGDPVPGDLDDRLRVTLISKVAREWGVDNVEGGKVLWCTVPTGAVPGQAGVADRTVGTKAPDTVLPAGTPWQGDGTRSAHVDPQHHQR